mmetsp:Transcript_18277/g.40004  ORF Transcript_18277/g.40004 Transcript_18277/m.40004 type:complete len:83 (-) Transcript_18277:179-427(-)
MSSAWAMWSSATSMLSNFLTSTLGVCAAHVIYVFFDIAFHGAACEEDRRHGELLVHMKSTFDIFVIAGVPNLKLQSGLGTNA